MTGIATPMDPTSALALSVLSALLFAAVATDLRTRRIPNVLLVVGLALGLLIQAAAPSGSGLFSPSPGGVGLVAASAGAAIGLALFLPMYIVRAIGAGDVKLLAVVGVWLAAPAVLRAALWTLLAGGALSLVAALANGVLRQVLRNIRDMLYGSLVRAPLGHSAQLPVPPRTTGRLPYALAIACGTGVEVTRLLMQSAA